MGMELDIAVTESLRDFALAHGEISFNHLCNAALDTEEWAVERIGSVLRQIALSKTYELWRDGADRRLEIIRATDTSRPDGAIARSFEV